ncbi:DUF885 domain-containing protein [Chitinophaga sp. YR573]|uniref:DUF885 domain-containing protein n=1 Tax=Chitinophaga sp. YR573 TaxID=1881040 RepID=UPI0015A5D78E|nr:DUF885 domain-containing protein [Chitinophaga sp. YR573]
MNLKCFMLMASSLFITQSSIAQQKKLQQLFENYYRESLQLQPLDATFLGYHEYDDQLANDISAPYIAEVSRFDEKYLKLLSSFDKEQLTPADRISVDVLKKILSRDLESRKLHLEYLPLNHFNSIPLFIGQLGSGSSAQPFKTVQDYRNWIRRIAAFKIWAATAILNMKKGASAGTVLPKVLVMKIIPQMEALGKDDSLNVFYTPLKTLPAEFKQEISDELGKAIREQLLPAYQQLADYLKNEYLAKATDSSGLSGIVGGAAMYRYYVKYYTTTDSSPEEIYQKGLDEVSRIRAKMELIKTRTGFSGTLNEFFTFLKSDPQFMPFKTPEQVLQAYRDVYAKIKPHLPELFSIFPKADFEIRRVESFREAGQNGPSYTLGSIDGKRPGVFYVPVPDATKINTVSSAMEATFIHEAVPGHHFQISLQQENNALPTFRRSISFNAFTEGWALYIESLGSRLGCYTDPYQEMAALNNEMMRAIRLVTDVGLHTGKMTREQSIAYIMANLSTSEADATSATERYMAMPGQALSYKTGELEILRLRAMCEKRLGKKFSIIKFHDALLAQGDMPMTVLENYINDWCSRQ